MKRAVYILLIFVLFIFSAAFFLKPAAIFLAKRNLSRVFIDSSVFIRGCSISPLRSITLSDLEIKNSPAYDFKISRIKIEYGLAQILKGRITKVSLEGASISINLPGKSIAKFNQYLHLGSGGAFLVQSAELKNLDLEVNANDLKTQARLSVAADLAKQRVDYCDLIIDSLEAQGLKLDGLILMFNRAGNSAGSLSIKQIKYDKARIRELQSRVTFENFTLVLDSLSAGFLDGKLLGSLTVKLDKNAQVKLALKFMDLNLEAFIKDFELGEKAQASGRLTGGISLEARGLDIAAFKGVFSSLGSGGTLVVKDTKFLEGMARNSGQSLDILVESFKNYRYNIGNIELFLDNGNLNFNVALDGEAGKRNLNIVVHAFNLKRR